MEDKAFRNLINICNDIREKREQPMLEAKDAVQGEVGRPDWKELSESLDRMIAELEKKPESTNYLQVLGPIRTQPKFTVGIYDQKDNCIPQASPYTYSTFKPLLSLEAENFVNEQVKEFSLSPNKLVKLFDEIEKDPELTNVLNNIDLYKALDFSDKHPNSTGVYHQNEPDIYYKWPFNVPQEALMAPGKIEPKSVPCIEGFDPNLQSFVCNCDVHNGVPINKHHIEQCGHLSWGRYYTPEEERNAVSQGFKQTMHIDKKYTTVPVWKTNRRVEGLAQVLSDDPIGYAEKQMRELTKLPRPALEVDYSNSSHGEGFPHIPKDDDSGSSWTVQTGLSAGMPKPSPKPFQYHSDKTKFYLVGDKKPWYRQQGFKWYKVIFYAFMTLFAKFFGKLIDGTSDNSNVILLTKQQLTSRLRFYTEIPYIQKVDRDHINDIVFVINSAPNTTLQNERTQDILRHTKEWTEKPYGTF